MNYSVIPNCAMPNQAKPCIKTNPGYTVILSTTLNCSKQVYTVTKSNQTVVWCVVVWLCGGVVYLTNYRTTPV